MHFPHTLLISLLAVLLWATSRLAAPPPPASAEDVPALAISGSGYGSLIARAMRSSLYSLWHGGEAYRAPVAPTAVQVSNPAAAPPPLPSTPGIFSRRRIAAGPTPPPPFAPPAPVASATPPSDPLIWRVAGWLDGLETRRTKRQSQSAISPAHARYLNSATGWRLRFACTLDPGDPVLYEICHDHILNTSKDIAKARGETHALSERALRYAESERGGMVDALTGVAAGVNVLNDLMMFAQSGTPDKEDVAEVWGATARCLKRYQELRAAAVQEGWWQDIPHVRRSEILDYAGLLERMTTKMHDHLVAKGLLANSQ